MKPKELRIGNLYNNNGKLKEVTPNTIKELWLAQRNWIKPIPLTEAWLLRAGFYKDNYGLFFKVKDNKPFKSGCKIHFAAKECNVNNALVWDIGKDFPLDKEPIHYTYIKHLHQLQNLYFALTGEELTLNETV